MAKKNCKDRMLLLRQRPLDGSTTRLTLFFHHVQSQAAQSMFLTSDLTSPRWHPVSQVLHPKIPPWVSLHIFKNTNYLQVIRWWCEKSGSPKIDDTLGKSNLGTNNLVFWEGTASWEAVQSLFIFFVGSRLKTIKANFLGKLWKIPFVLPSGKLT